MAEVSLAEIECAQVAIAPYVRHTPLIPAPSLSGDQTGVYFKLEILQDTLAFKLRGATNAVLSLTPEERSRGVVAVSTGNHGRGLAYAAGRLGVKAVICMSELVPDNKRQAIRDLGAEVCIHGRSQDEAQVEADRLVAEKGLVMVDPFDDPRVIAGQGTVGLEILADLPDVNSVLVPLSGGGLIAGVAKAVKSTPRPVRVIGITMDQGAAMYESQKAGKPVPVAEHASLADALGGGIGLENRYTFDMTRDYVDDMLLVSEEEIAAAMKHLYWRERLVVEGSGAVGVAAILSGKAEALGAKAVVVLSGRNVDMKRFTEVVTT